MKKFVYLLSCLLTVLLSMASIPVLAYDIAVENEDGITLYYNYFNNGQELELTRNGYYFGNIVIPDEVTYDNKKLKVTRIGSDAFSACLALTSVTIPNSVTTIEGRAFSNCI